MRRLQPALPAVPRRVVARQAPLRDRRLARPAARAARAHRVLRPARERGRGPAREGVQGRRAADGRVAPGQAALHRPAGGPPPARAGRELLQLGHDQDPAPRLLPERLHLRAAGHQHRVHRAARRADLPRLLPRRTRRWPTPSSGCSRTTRCWAPSPTSGATPSAWRPRSSGASTRSSCAPTSSCRCCRGCSIATRARTWSARSSTASSRCRSRCRSCTTPTASFYVDAALFGEDDLQMLFSFARAYFMVDMEVPSAYVQFLRSLMPRKPRAEIYNALGLAKQGKTLFYRDFLSHLNYSSDRFRIAPGIKGMVMLVFDLPSFPYVFKVIKDFYPPQKDTTREQIKGKYMLVKQHDRVGRMADTLEYSDVGFPLDRFEPDADRGDREVRAEPARDRRPRRQRGDGGRAQARLHRAPHDPAQHLPAGSLRPAGAAREPGHGQARARPAGACGGRVRQRHQGHGGGQHLPGRHAVEELRRHARRQGGVLRLRRDRIPHRLQLPQGARAAQRGRRDERRGLVLGRPEGRVPRDLRALPARQRRGARGLHGAPCRPARRRLLAEPQGTHPGRADARCVPVRRVAALPARQATPPYF